MKNKITVLLAAAVLAGLSLAGCKNPLYHEPPAPTFTPNLTQTAIATLWTATNTPTPISPANLIVFVSDRTGYDNIYSMRSDGSNQTNLSNVMDHDRSPVLSPDGSKILFLSLRGGPGYKIYVMNADGSNQNQLTSGGSDGSAQWSPDGSRIVFESDRVLTNRPEIYVMNADGSGQTRLTITGLMNGSPKWSPDGSKIAFYRYVNNVNPEIYVMNSDGSGITRLTNLPDGTLDFNPVWSPDGTKIAYFNNDSPDDIHVMNADGSNNVIITGGNGINMYPVWAPDGSRILFTSNRAGWEELYLISPGGSGLTRLTYYSGTTNTSVSVYDAQFSPDGSRIVFSRFETGNAEIYAINSNGGGLVNLTNNAGFDTSPDW